ncbi:hypothetical protein [[Phormidium] sp. LEGE 05292]|uniref:hypothetical protein n=1 Tax=[Phormidium] sp. LEGE 05292 TaxID=767427 RepID=UPI001D136BA2|nr:hypothetical protein [Phormidium sp. LEGE 05292]
MNREAIALAIETGEQRILLDEREARQVAQSLGLQVISCPVDYPHCRDVACNVSTGFRIKDIMVH